MAASIPRIARFAAVVARLTAISEYRQLFARAFGGSDAVNEDNLGRALAAFQRTLVAANAPFDRYMRGDTAAMSPEQVRGMERFQSAGCINCHSGPMFSDFDAHVLGGAGQREAVCVGFRREQDIRIPNAVAAQPELRPLPTCTTASSRRLPEVIDFYRRISRGGGGRGGRGGIRGA